MEYYDPESWGDQLIRYTFDEIILENPKYKVTFVNTKTDAILNLSENALFDLVLIGGGLRYTKCEKTIEKIKTHIGYDIPIVFYGLAPSGENYDIGDRFYVRNTHDLNLMKERYTNDFVHYTPDTAFLLRDVPKNNPESDDLVRSVGVTGIGEPLEFTTRYTMNEMFREYSGAKIIVANKYHAIITCILTETPFVAVTNGSIGLQRLKEDCQPFITNLFVQNENEVHQKVRYLREHYDYYHEKLRELRCWFNEMALKAMIHFHENCLKIRCLPPQYTSDDSVLTMKHQIAREVLREVGKLTPVYLERLSKGGTLSGILQLRKAPDPTLIKRVVYKIIYMITKDPESHYLPKLTRDIFNKEFRMVVMDTIKDYYEKYHVRRLNDTVVINHNFRTIHNSWQRAVDRITTLESPLIIDTFLEKTFGSSYHFYKTNGVIPYKRDWVGFIHYPDLEVLNNSDLDLEYCKGLIVMSNYLATKLSLKAPGVPVFKVTLPVEQPTEHFLWENFIASPKRRVVQIGTFCRDLSAIYRLELPESSIVTGKAILSSQQLMATGVHPILDEFISSVEHLPWLSDEKYDELLCSSIVFLKLTDASAISTIIECVVRCTPILVNPLPPVVEILGVDYPLYFDTYYRASWLLDNPDLIKKAHHYLQTLPKSEYKLSTFVQNVTEIF